MSKIKLMYLKLFLEWLEGKYLVMLKAKIVYW